jgi:hypothetical protein
VRADLNPSGGREALMAWQVGRRSCGVKAAVGRDELGGASVQPGTASSLHPCRGACVCKATDHAHAGWGLLMREQSKSGAPEMQPSAAVLQGATRVCRPCFSGTRA